jgi:hypothetical protein
MKAITVEQAAIQSQAAAVSNPPALIRDISDPVVIIRVRIQIQKAKHYSAD